MIGLFEVDDPQEGIKKKKGNYLLDDDFWSASIIHYIKPYLLPDDGKFLDFKKLLRENEEKLPFEFLS